MSVNDFTSKDIQKAQNSFFSSLACNMVNAGNLISDLNGLNSFLPECGENRGSRYEAEHRVAGHRHGNSGKSTTYHTGDESVFCTFQRRQQLFKLYHKNHSLSRKNSALVGIPKNSFKRGEKNIKINLFRQSHLYF